MRRRKQEIREYVKKALVDKTDAGSNVIVSRAIPSWSENLPQLNVYSADEPVSEFHQSPKTYKREYAFNVECTVAAGSKESLDDLLDVIVEQVEQAIEIDDSLGKLVDFCNLANVNYSGEPDGDALIGSAILTYQAVFLQEAIGPEEASYKDLKGIDVVYNLSGLEENGEPVKDAEDTINFNE